MFYLVCIQSFTFNGVTYVVGQEITNKNLMADLMAENAAYFTQIDQAQSLGLIYLAGIDSVFLSSGVDGDILGGNALS